MLCDLEIHALYQLLLHAVLYKPNEEEEEAFLDRNSEQLMLCDLDFHA